MIVWQILCGMLGVAFVIVVVLLLALRSYCLKLHGVIVAFQEALAQSVAEDVARRQ